MQDGTTAVSSDEGLHGGQALQNAEMQNDDTSGIFESNFIDLYINIFKILYVQIICNYG